MTLDPQAKPQARPRYGLTPAMRDLMCVIQELQDAGKSVSYRALAREMDIRAASGIARMLASLAERGYLARRRDDGDWRRLHLEVLQRVAMPDEFEFVPVIKVPAWLLETPEPPQTGEAA